MKEWDILWWEWGWCRKHGRGEGIFGME